MIEVSNSLTGFYIDKYEGKWAVWYDHLDYVTGDEPIASNFNLLDEAIAWRKLYG